MYSKTYSSPNHFKSLMQVLNNQRKSREFCDVTFIVEGKEIYAHKNILCASSQYFRSMFNENFQEASLDKIPLHGLDYSAFNMVLNYIYTSKIELNDKNDYNVMEVVDFLQIYELKPYITHHMKQKVDIKNCIKMYEICTLRNYKEAAHKAFIHLIINFETVIESGDYLDIPIDLWYKIVNSDVLDVPSENILLDAMLKSNICIEDREKLSKIVKTTERSYDFKHLVMVIGGGYSNSSECFPSSMDPWSFHLPMWGPYNPEDESELVISNCPPLQDFASTYNDDEAFILGGCDPDQKLSNKCYKYNVRLNMWKEFESLPVALKLAAAAFCEDRIYISGGFDESNKETNIFMYYIKQSNSEGKWIKAAPMFNKRTGHSLCTVNGVLYAFGGVSLADPNTKEQVKIKHQPVEVYYPDTNTWRYATSMPNARPIFCSAVVEEYIYIFGAKVVNDFRSDTSCVHRYNTLKEEWNMLEMPYISSNYSRAVNYQDKILVMGNSSQVTAPGSDVLSYNPETNQWRHVPPMKLSRAHPAVAVFRLPQYRNYKYCKMLYRNRKRLNHDALLTLPGS